MRSDEVISTTGHINYGVMFNRLRQTLSVMEGMMLCLKTGHAQQC